MTRLPAPDTAPHARAGVIRLAAPLKRALKNAGWLLGGKGAAALLSLFYLALVSRTLGVAGFGVFATVLAYAQAIENLAGFQSWQPVIHFGAKHLAASQPGRLARLLSFLTALDCAAAIVGAAGAATGALLVGPALGWTDSERWLAAAFSVSLIVGQRGTPTGVLRLFDRFDSAAKAEVILPVTRLAGAGAAWLSGGGLASYLFAWGVAELATTTALWIAAVRTLRANDVPVAFAGLGVVRHENSGIIRFAVTTNLSASIGLLWQQAPVLLVGWASGSAAAGGYRLAAQLGTSLAKPIAAFARSIYPEFARMAADGAEAQLRSSLLQVERVTGLLGLLGILIALTLGPTALLLIGGSHYQFASTTLTLVAIASAVGLCGFGLEPALVALGRPGRALVARAAGGLFYVTLVVALGRSTGPTGAAWAAILANSVSMVLLRLAFARTIVMRKRQLDRLQERNRPDCVRPGIPPRAVVRSPCRGPVFDGERASGFGGVRDHDRYGGELDVR